MLTLVVAIEDPWLAVTGSRLRLLRTVQASCQGRVTDVARLAGSLGPMGGS
jgi:hypothetical protein